MPRSRLDFRVDRLVDTSRVWLQPSGAWGAEDTAAQFAMHIDETISERLRIEASIYRLAGGALSWEELKRAHREMEEALDREIADLGRPMIGDRWATDDEWRQFVAMSRYLHQSDVGAAWRASAAMMERICFMCRWPVLIIDAPNGMRTLEDMDRIAGGMETIDLIIHAVNRAGSELQAGKAQPSQS
jgi:hypothetical protein